MKQSGEKQNNGVKYQPTLPVFTSIIVSLSFLFTGIAGCTSPDQSSTIIPGTTPQIETGTGYTIQVFRGEEKAGELTLTELSKLDKVQFNADGKDEEGPTLMSALALVSISSFNEITFYGYSRGRLATAELTLKRDQINDQVILDFSNQGTCKLAGVDIPSNDWIIDMNKMVVN
jgi:hypothetical protein